jgi:hypothetical protein
MTCKLNRGPLVRNLLARQLYLSWQRWVFTSDVHHSECDRVERSETWTWQTFSENGLRMVNDIRP